MADKRFINQKDAKIIGDNLNAINSRLNTMPKETIPSRPVRARKGIPAKITQVGEDGLYNLKEQIISDDGKSFEDKQNGRIWDGQQGNLPQALEINSNDKLDIDNIVYVWNSGSSSADKNKWFFDSGSTQGAGSGVAVKNHIEFNKKKIQFKNDVEEAATDLALGPALYSELYRADVAWRYLWNKLLPGSGTLLPQASLDSSGNLDLTEFNKRQLRFAVMELQNGLRQLMIYHDILPDDQTDDANEMWQDHTDSSANGQYWIDRAGADALADDANPLTHSEFLALLKRPQFDNIGHLKVLDGYKSPENPYKPDEPPNTTGFKLDVQYTGTYPSSGTLFNVAISQVTKVTDENGADKVYTETDSLFWQVIPSWASIIKSALSPNIAIGEGTLGDSTNYAGASYGNNTDVNHDLARYFNTSFKLKGTIVENDVNDTSDYLVTDTLYLDSPSFQSSPASNVDFNVFCPLLDVAGGSRYSRFDGIGEYRIVGFLYWESAGFDFTNPDIQMYLAKEESDVVSFDSNTKSGANLTFNVSIDTSDESDNLCLAYYLEFYNNTDAPINAYGYCFDGDGSFLFNNACTPVANTGTNYNFTLTLTPDEISNNTESVIQGNVLSIEDLSDTIAVDLSIDDGGADTNDFSTAGKSVTIWVEYNGQEILFNDVCCNSPQNPYIGDLQPGLNNYQNLIVANHGSTTTDGYSFVLNTLEGTISDGELSLGTYVVKARVEGYEDIITKTFLVKTIETTTAINQNSLNYYNVGSPVIISSINVIKLDREIDATYTILIDSVATNNFTGDTVNIELFNSSLSNVKFELNNNNTALNVQTLTISNPVNGTDGVVFDITAIESSFINDGDVLTLKATLLDTPDATNNFTMLDEPANDYLAKYLFNNNYDDVSGNFDITSTSSAGFVTDLIRLQTVDFTSTSSSMVGIPPLTSESAASATIWIKRDVAWTNLNTILSHDAFAIRNTTTSNESIIVFPSFDGGTVSFENYGPSVDLNTLLDIDIWHHLAVTYDGTTPKLYIDGVEVTLTAGSTGSGSLGYTPSIGDSGPVTATRGGISIARFYNRELTSTEVVNIYNFEILTLEYTKAAAQAETTIEYTKATAQTETTIEYTKASPQT